MMTTIFSRGPHHAPPSTQKRVTTPRRRRTGVLALNRGFRRSWGHTARQEGKAHREAVSPDGR